MRLRRRRGVVEKKLAYLSHPPQPPTPVLRANLLKGALH